MAAIPSDFTTSTAHIATYINANFTTDEDKVRAVFYWTASTISYDVKNMLVDNSSETSQEKITKTLKSHKGVCIHYAEVFHAIVDDLGIKNFIIEGFTKQEGKINNLAHAWCAVAIAGKWYLVDPTWGSGGVRNGVFVKKLNNNYFKVEPNKMVSSHLSFDYLWQFLPNPLTFDAFVTGKIQQASIKKNFNFEEEIIRFQSLSDMDKLFESVQRIENNGYKPAVITTYLAVIKKNASVSKQNSAVEKMNSIVSDYNQAIVFLNDFIFYRNNKFKPSVTDEQLEKMVVEAKERLSTCQVAIYSVGDVGSENRADLSSLKSKINDALRNSEEQFQFVQQYLKKSTLGRKMMLAQVSWFGVPLR